MKHPEPRILFARSQGWATTHCACAVDGLMPEPAPAAAPRGLWRQASELFRAPLPQAHEVFFNPRGAAGPAVLNAPARDLFRAFRQPQPLASPHAQQLARLHLLQPLDQASSPAPAPAVRPQVLTAWLHVTNACNLRCTYCFVHKNADAMDETIGRAAVDAVFRSARAEGFRAVKLKYAGGEATLNFDLIRTLHRHARRLSERHGIALQEVILSNGVALTPAMLDFIRDNDLTLSISLDGLGEGHDAQRVFANGVGSGPWVRRGIERALDRGVAPHLSITVTSHNVQELPQVVAFALERQLYFNINFYQEHQPWQRHETLRAQNEALIAGLRAALQVIEADLPPYNVFTSMLDRANLAAGHTRACGAGDSYLVIDHCGQIARCQMEMHHPVTDIHAQQPLADIRLYEPGDREPHFVDVDDKTECAACPWRYACGGGCTMMTYRVHGRTDVKSPYCDVYKAIFPEILRLEGLRLLKWEGSAAHAWM